VAELLEELRIEFTKSRPNGSQDNALVEGEKRRRHSQTHRLRAHSRSARRAGAEVLYGASEPIPELTSAMWLCDGDSQRARQTPRRYPAADYATPYEKLQSLLQAEQYLKAGKPLRSCKIESPFQDHLVLESNLDFRIILRLENAISRRHDGRR
jgi:hypothetical protein